MPSRSLGHRAPLLWVLLPLGTGLLTGKLGWLSGVPPTWAALVAVAAAIVALVWARARMPALVASVFLSGVALYAIERARLPAWETLPIREVRVTLEIERTFAPKPDRRTVSGLARIVGTDAHLPDLVGQRVYFSLLPARGRETAPLIRSAHVATVGVLELLPRDPPLDSFEGYLANAGANFRLTRGRLGDEVHAPGAYRRFCDATLAKFDAVLDHGIAAHPRLSGVFRAMMLGQQQELSDEQKTLFRQSGTMHLFAISGLHITAIYLAIHGVLMLLPIPRAAQFAIGVGVLWLYVDVTGTTPSAVRAFIMVALVQSSLVLRVPGNALAALVASAVIVLIAQPMQLFSASFQMSYGIVAALLLLGLPLAERCQDRWALFAALPKVTWGRTHHVVDWAWRALVGTLAIGLATMLVSTISGVIFFKLLTPASLFANLVLIPVSTLVIFAGLLSLAGGLVGLGEVALIFNHAAVVVLIAVEWAVARFVSLPAAYVDVAFRSTSAGYGVFALVLATMLWGYARGWTGKTAPLWLPFAVTVAALVLTARGV